MTEPLQPTLAEALLAMVPHSELDATRVTIEHTYTQLDVQSVDSWTGDVNGLACRIANHLQQEKDTLAGATSTPPAAVHSEVQAVADPFLVYRAEHDVIVMGLYLTAAEARKHCETALSADYPDHVSLIHDWIGDDSDPLEPVDLVTQLDGGDEVATGYTVTPLEVAAAYDADADE